MSLEANPKYKDAIEEIRVNFSVIHSTIENLRDYLKESEFLTSYVFISDNIRHAVRFVRDQLESIETKSKDFENICISSPFQIATYMSNPAFVFEYRDSTRDFVDKTRVVTNGLYGNVGRTLAAYILVYETLEKFKLRPPFVLVESNEFTNDTLPRFIFSDFEPLGSRSEFKPTKAQVITYSGIDITDPLSLLVIGHEAFHIIDRLLHVFEDFCKATGFRGDSKYEDAVVDMMGSLYYGPVYAYAMQKYFAKRYPLSGESHVEMNVRLLFLSFLQSKLGFKEKKVEGKTFNEFIAMLERRMKPTEKEKAREEKKKLEAMLDKGIIGHVTHFFKERKITPYDEFVNVVEKRELQTDLEKIGREKIRFMLNKGIPVAARPVSLLNALNDTGDIDTIEPRLITASLKKWYVKRYYQKGIEARVKQR